MHSRHVEIKSPCHESWDAMHGDDSRRFCDVCAKHVHNLSAMERDEATELLRANKGDHLCVRYASHEDGSIAFRDSLVPMSRLRSVRTAFAAVMLAACTPHGDGPPIQDLGEVAIEAMARDAVASPEGGCDVRTGPLTTLHYPAGHEVCRYLPDRGATIVQPTQPGYTPPPPQPPQPPPPMMGQMAVVEQPKMGEAVPELKEPCDPQPNFAPPPPISPPTVYEQGEVAEIVEPPPTPPQPRVLMGDVAAPDLQPPPPPPPEPRVKMGKMKPTDMKTGGAVVGDID